MEDHRARYREREVALDDLIATYLRRAASGHPPDRQSWLARHPEWAPELATFFEDFDWVQSLATPVRATAAGNGERDG